MRFGNLLIGVASQWLSQQGKNGAMPPGHNGPYFDQETPVRNTAHWLQLFLLAYELSNEERFEVAAQRCMAYLLKVAPKPGCSYDHRSAAGKDRCNGLIGQAWTIEALAAAHEHFGEAACLETAQSLVATHPFDAERCLWHRVNPDGEVLPPDNVFNHQLWFAAAASQVAPPESPNRVCIEQFLARLPENMLLARNGRIQHLVQEPSIVWRRRVKFFLMRDLGLKALVKEVGYHLFNLYAFAMMHRTLAPDFPELRRILDYVLTDEFLSEIAGSPYSYEYNPPGFEYPAVWSVFFTDREGYEKPERWIIEQVRRTYSPGTFLFQSSSGDYATLTARLYECKLWERSLFDTHCFDE